MKSIEKRKAIRLRVQGFTYSQILNKVKVSRSTLSVWLRNIQMTYQQKNHIKNLINKTRLNTQKQRKNLTRLSTKTIVENAKNEIVSVDINCFKLIGASLYWAEGSKQRNSNLSQGLIFSNSDPNMILLYLNWLKLVLHVKDENIILELYIHIGQLDKKNDFINYWSNKTKLPRSKFDRIYVKKHALSKKYSNNEYKGLVRIIVRKSSKLNRQVTGWIQGICQQCGIV